MPRPVLAALLLLAACDDGPEMRCVQSEERKVVTYPYLAFIGVNRPLALMPVVRDQRVCVKWGPASGSASRLTPSTI